MDQPSRSFGVMLEKLKNMLPALKAQYHIQSLEVFGSFVRGEESKDSDLDLLVTFDQVPTLFQFVNLENTISDELGIPVDLVMKENLKPSIAKYILDEAMPI